MRTARWSVAVVVPARDEGDDIGRCLASLLATDLPSSVERWIVVVADRCTDDTAVIARRVLGAGGEVLETDVGNVGEARRLGTDRALARLAGRPLDRTWLLTTDADGSVPSCWIRTHLALADAGAAAVAGSVVLADDVDLPAHATAALAARYVVHPDGTHPHVHGANLGVRGDAYRAAGGWRPLPTAEDHDLWDRLGVGGGTTSTTTSPVLTSGRTVGRAPLGFAGLLATLVAGIVP